MFEYQSVRLPCLGCDFLWPCILNLNSNQDENKTTFYFFDAI